MFVSPSKQWRKKTLSYGSYVSSDQDEGTTTAGTGLLMALRGVFTNICLEMWRSMETLNIAVSPKTA